MPDARQYSVRCKTSDDLVQVYMIPDVCKYNAYCNYDLCAGVEGSGKM